MREDTSTSVMLSLKPEWCQRILSEEKTFEIRKNVPNLKAPFKVYMYCTKNHDAYDYLELHYDDGRILPCNQKVVASFTCDFMLKLHPDPVKGYILQQDYMKDVSVDKASVYRMVDSEEMLKRIIEKSCLSMEELVKYGKGRPIYAWHVKDVEIFDEPKALNQFHFPASSFCEKELCGGCPYDQCASPEGEYDVDCEWKRPLQKAPQSWCYAKFGLPSDLCGSNAGTIAELS